MTLLEGSDPRTRQAPAAGHDEPEAATDEPGSPDPAPGSALSADGPGPAIHDNQVGRDLNVGENVNVTNYLTRLAHLQPHPIARESILARTVFEPPSGFDVALTSLTSLTTPDRDDGRFAGVLVLVSQAGVGARTEALRLLDECLPQDGRIFELFPDWEEPEVARIPQEKQTGYLLNFSGESDLLSDAFRDRLTQYAITACDRGTRLIVLAGRQVWGPVLPAPPQAPVVAVQAAKPSPAGVAERRLQARPETKERVAWLHDDYSVFNDLLTPDTTPRAAVHLADVIARADGPKDGQARDEYLGWHTQLEIWFSGGERDTPPPRALRIAAAFLDSCPARAVLDSADQLLAARKIGWPAEPGGVLAGPDAKTRCTQAGIAFRDDGTASLNDAHPGIGDALLRHVWHTRPQLVPILTTWLGQISAGNGPATPHLDKLAASLTVLAQVQGPAAIMALIEQWLSENKRRNLAVTALDDLAVHPRIGAPVRNSLRNWAKAPTKPDRQEAVAEICGRQFGREFTHLALNRLRDVLETAAKAGPRQQALKTLGRLLGTPLFAPQTLTALADWAAAPSTEASPASASAFVHLLSIPLTTPDSGDEDHKPDPSLVHGLLTWEGEEGEAIRQLLSNGWRASWQRTNLRSQTAVALDGWCTAAENGALPHAPFKTVISVIFEEEANALGDDLNHIIGGHSPLRLGLRRQYTETVFRAGAAPGAPAAAPLPQ